MIGLNAYFIREQMHGIKLNNNNNNNNNNNFLLYSKTKKTPLELYLFIMNFFRNNAQTTLAYMECSNTRSLYSDHWSSQRTETLQVQRSPIEGSVKACYHFLSCSMSMHFDASYVHLAASG